MSLSEKIEEQFYQDLDGIPWAEPSDFLAEYNKLKHRLNSNNDAKLNTELDSIAVRWVWDRRKEKPQLYDGPAVKNRLPYEVYRQIVEKTLTTSHVIPTELQIGSFHANRYRVKKKIGAGGYGVVYLAIDETLNIEVAIKSLASPTGSHLAARFF